MTLVASTLSVLMLLPVGLLLVVVLPRVTHRKGGSNFITSHAFLPLTALFGLTFSEGI